VLVALAALGALAGRARAEDGSAAVEELPLGPAEHVLGQRLREPDDLARYYGSGVPRPRWLRPDGSLGPEARELLASVEGSARQGLHPDAYHSGALSRLADAAPIEPQIRAGLEILLSDAFLHLARHVSAGAVDPWRLHPGFRRAGPAPPDPVPALVAARESGRVAGTLAGMAPPHPEYAALCAELERLRESGGAGAPHAARRSDRVRASLERWRWLPRDLGARHLRVNIPSFTVRAFEDGAPALAMRVVVGSAAWQTPIMDGVITELILNPAWWVPRSIATREMLPAVRRDPDYFSRTGIEVLADEGGVTRAVDPRRVDWSSVTAEGFPFRLRQPPGPRNPMGRIKFSFPNRYAVYLHGTPSDAGFERPLRTLSHGCVRVEDEVALALFALAPDPAWTRARLEQALRGAPERPVRLPVPLSVYLLYFTATVDAEGAVSVTGDPYGWDEPLLDALDAGVEGDPQP